MLELTNTLFYAVLCKVFWYHNRPTTHGLEIRGLVPDLGGATCSLLQALYGWPSDHSTDMKHLVKCIVWNSASVVYYFAGTMVILNLLPYNAIFSLQKWKTWH